MGAASAKPRCVPWPQTGRRTVSLSTCGWTLRRKWSITVSAASCRMCCGKSRRTPERENRGASFFRRRLLRRGLGADALDRYMHQLHRSARLIVGIARDTRDFADDVLAVHHLPEDRVAAVAGGRVQRRVGDLGDEELAAARVG